jgi:hypothetical protein
MGGSKGRCRTAAPPSPNGARSTTACKHPCSPGPAAPHRADWPSARLSPRGVRRGAAGREGQLIALRREKLTQLTGPRREGGGGGGGLHGGSGLLLCWRLLPFCTAVSCHSWTITGLPPLFLHVTL